jgi:hypothetical protein
MLRGEFCLKQNSTNASEAERRDSLQSDRCGFEIVRKKQANDQTDNAPPAVQGLGSAIPSFLDESEGVRV